MNAIFSIVIDKRRPKKDPTGHPIRFHIRLRVYSSVLKKSKRYKLGIALSETDYNKITFPKQGERLSKELNDIKIKLNRFEDRAKQVIDNIETFTFEVFERNYFRDSCLTNSVLEHFRIKIEGLEEREKIGTAESYKCSLNSIKKFLDSTNKKIEALKFAEINHGWLDNYEHYMLSNGKSKTTVGIYLRPVGHLFNNAIRQKDISQDYYPFGKNGYMIPKGGGVKKALSREQLKILFDSEPKTPQQEKAKDFWFLSYALHGMNIQDIANLMFSNLKEDRIEFIREKTKDRTNGTKQITTFLNDVSQGIISKYQNKKMASNDYVFSILSKEMTPIQIKAKVKIFTRFINQHLKKLAESNDLPKDISTYWARHTFATNSVNKGASLEFMREALGHTDLKTTQSYFAGFTNETKKDFAQTLFNF